MLRIFQPLAAAVLLAGAFAARAFAQCPRPDHLDCGTCCNVAQADIPKLPAFQQDSLDICWRDCNVDNVIPTRVRWGKPVSSIGIGGVADCGVYNTDMRLFNSAGAVTWRGKFRMIYSRTWLESSPVTNYQVFRFLVNGDISPTQAAGGTPCPVPPCAPAFANRVHVTGYIDYARDCQTGTFEFAWMLSHVCDSIDHHPGFPRAGAFHPDRSYSFVGPAAGFAPGPVQPTEGGAGPFEDLRRLIYPAPGTVGPIMCDFEEQIQHSLQPIQQYCQCASTGNSPMQWFLGNLFIAGACGSNVQTNGGPFLPGYHSMGLGMWTDPLKYPGQEFLRWNVGNYDYFDPCVVNGRREVFYGVTTLRGFPAFQALCTGAGPTLPLIFIDQANSLRSGNTVMNIPYTSDHIVNLNE